MNQNQLRTLDRELNAYVDAMVTDMGRPERRHAMGLYLTGLLLKRSPKPVHVCSRKTVRSV
jgi:hypothetical protein